MFTSIWNRDGSSVNWGGGAVPAQMTIYMSSTWGVFLSFLVSKYWSNFCTINAWSFIQRAKAIMKIIPLHWLQQFTSLDWYLDLVDQYYHVTVFQITAFQNTQITVVYNVCFIISLIFVCFIMKNCTHPPAPYLGRARRGVHSLHPPTPTPQ